MNSLKNESARALAFAMATGWYLRHSEELNIMIESVRKETRILRAIAKNELTEEILTPEILRKVAKNIEQKQDMLEMPIDAGRLRVE